MEEEEGEEGEAEDTIQALQEHADLKALLSIVMQTLVPQACV